MRYDVSWILLIVTVLGSESVDVAMPGDDCRHTGLAWVGDVGIVREMAGMEGFRPCWPSGPVAGENKQPEAMSCCDEVEYGETRPSSVKTAESRVSGLSAEEKLPVVPWKVYSRLEKVAEMGVVKGPPAVICPGPEIVVGNGDMEGRPSSSAPTCGPWKESCHLTSSSWLRNWGKLGTAGEWVGQKAGFPDSGLKFKL